MSKDVKPQTSQGLEDFLKYIRATVQSYSMAQADEQQANNETQDILHAIELNTSAWKPAQLLRKLQHVRERRRIAKDTIAASEPVVKWANENQSVIKALEQLLGDVRKQERRMQNRVYVSRSNIMDELHKEAGHRG